MSEVTYISIKQKDGYITKLTHYACSKSPKASILILHGMAEHQKRYHAFAEYLVNLGYDVYSYDHRGHGMDKKFSDLGYFGPVEGHRIVVEDAIAASSYIEKNNRCSKFFLFGHSMGSLISRNVIQLYSNYDGVILSGTANPPELLTLTGLFFSTVIVKFMGPRHVSPFLNNLMFSNKKYTSLSTRTAFDWLSRSNTAVGAYINDPFCGFACSSSFYRDLIKITQNVTDKKQIPLTRRNLPFLIISGGKDPVGGYGKEVQKFAADLKTLEFSDITCKLYPDCRHEILNELNYEEVYSDIHEWIENKI